MPAIALTNTMDFEVYSSNYYAAKLVKTELVDKPIDNYNDKPYQEVKWSWVLSISGRDDRPSFSTWTKLSIHEKSKMAALLKAFGVEIEKLPKAMAQDGKMYPTIDPDDFLGWVLRINIQEVQAKTGGTKNKDAGYAALAKANDAKLATLYAEWAARTSTSVAAITSMAPAAAAKNAPAAEEDPFADDPEDPNASF